uniref:Uncharacterized protein n=1 Tax=Parascaris univalens TaxID=6257 RepID=A0A915C9A1_PARUN
MYTYSCVRVMFHVATRTMSQLACRFCAGVDFIHIVDPLLDLRYRFDNKQRLSHMLKARKIELDVDNLELKYKRWWKAYEEICADLKKEKRDPSLKRQLLEESEGLLGALRLPNDLTVETPTQPSIRSLNSRSSSNSPKHMTFLRKAGMVKIDEQTSSLHIVGLPTSLQNAIEKTILQYFAPSTILVSPPHIVRGAIIEAVNMPLEVFASFSDSVEGSSTNYLTGHGLISLLSIFTKTRFTRSSNKWPVGRIGRADSYISNRLNIVVSDGKNANKTEFLRLVYAELDITRLVGVITEEYLMGTKRIPDSIRRML